MTRRTNIQIETEIITEVLSQTYSKACDGKVGAWWGSEESYMITGPWQARRTPKAKHPIAEIKSIPDTARYNERAICILAASSGEPHSIADRVGWEYGSPEDGDRPDSWHDGQFGTLPHMVLVVNAPYRACYPFVAQASD